MAEENENDINLDDTSVSTADPNGDTGTGDDKQLSPEEAIAKMQEDLAKEREARISAERDAREARAGRSQAETHALSEGERAFNEREARVETDLEAAKNNVMALRKQYREAYEAGDSEKVDEINDLLMDAKINVKNIENAKSYMANQKQQIAAQSALNAALNKANNTDEPLTDNDINLIYPPHVRGWINANPEFKKSREFRNQATRAHHAAIAEGISDNSPEYFDFVEKKLGLRKSNAQEDSDQEPEPETKKQQFNGSSAAPVRSASSLGGSNSGKRFVKLTPEQKEAAEISGMSEAEYAKYLAEGNLN